MLFENPARAAIQLRALTEFIEKEPEERCMHLTFYFCTVMVIMFFLEAMTSPRAASSGIIAPRVPRGFSGM